MKRIASSANPHYKSLLVLKEKTGARARSGRALLDGMHLVQAYYERYGAPCLVAVTESAHADAEMLRLLEALEPGQVLLLDDKLFKKISTVDSPTGIIAAVSIPAPEMPVKAVKGACVLLEDIQDPGNLGSILRSAAAAGMADVLLSPKCADAWSPRVLRAGMGAHFHLRVYENCDLVAFAMGYPGRVIALAGEAQTVLYDCNLRGAVALILGNEGVGLSEALQESAQETVAIPMQPGTESLNVAAAAAVCCFERLRQMRARA